MSESELTVLTIIRAPLVLELEQLAKRLMNFAANPESFKRNTAHNRQEISTRWQRIHNETFRPFKVAPRSAAGDIAVDPEDVKAYYMGLKSISTAPIRNVPTTHRIAVKSVSKKLATAVEYGLVTATYIKTPADERDMDLHNRYVAALNSSDYYDYVHVCPPGTYSILNLPISETNDGDSTQTAGDTPTNSTDRARGSAAG